MLDISQELPDETLESVIARYLEAADAGQPPDTVEFIQRHQRHEAELHRYFENLALVEELAAAEKSNSGFVSADGLSDETGIEGAETSPTSDAGSGPPDIPEQFGRYRILELIGRGAMGSVYAAHDTQLDRKVALKVPRFSAAEDDEVLARSHREARAAAKLHHPNICPVHDSGEIDGRHYISMAFIQGHTLKEYVTAGTPHPQEHVALTVRKLAQAVAEAHRQGMIHRDLKSANVMVDEAGEPIVMDFGLVRTISMDGAGVTSTGAILGTPAYMSPEQVEGNQKRIGPASDVYGLGVILYELLTGQLPFTGPVHAILKQVIADDPPRPSKLRANLDPVLEAICLKAIEKRPANRYQSMDEFAEDLRRFLTHEPTLARPSGRLDSIRRWLRRHPTRAALIGVFAVGLPIAIALAGWALDRQSTAIVAERELAQSLYVRALIEGEQGDAGVVLLRLADALEPAVAGGDAELETIIRRQLGAWQRAVPTQARSFPQGGHVFAIAVSPDGRFVATGGNDGIPGDKDGTARLWNANTGDPVGSPLEHEDTVFGVDISPDGTRVVTGSADGTAQVWETGSGRRIGAAMTHDHRVLAVSFSPDGTIVLTGSHDTSARLWKADRGEPIGLPLQHGAIVRCVDFSPDGRTVLTAGDDGRVQFWSTETGQPTGEIQAHSDKVFAARFSPDGRVVLTGSEDRTAQLWEIESGSRVGPRLRHKGRVSSVAFGPAGATLMTGSLDRTVRLWLTSTGRPLAQIPHNEKVTAIAFSPHGDSLLTGGWDGQVRWWGVNDRLLTLKHPHQVRSAAYREDGRTIYTVSGNGLVHQWDAATGERRQPPVVHHDIWHRNTILSPDGTMLLAGGAEDALQISRTDSEQPVMRKFNMSQEEIDQLEATCFSPDGRIVLTGSLDNTARLWDVESGRPLLPPIEHTSAVSAVAFNPDGERFVTGSWNRMVQVWDVSTGAPSGEPLEHTEGVSVVSVSPDGRWIAAAIFYQNTVHLWSTATGTPHGQILRHPQRVRKIVFSPDSGTVVTTGDDNFVRLWSVSDGRPLGPSLHMPDIVSTAVFSPDGETLLIGSQDGTVHVHRIKPRLDGTPQQIRRWVEVITASELDEQGTVRLLDAETWAERRDALERPGGSPVPEG